MEVKLSLTTRCGARCSTCPSWRRPQEDMPVGLFKMIWDRLGDWSASERILVMINNTGDVYHHPAATEILEYISKNRRGLQIIMTTNGSGMDYIPTIDGLMLSWNGGDPGMYREMTGLDWEKVRARVRMRYGELVERIPRLEIHSLVCQRNFHAVGGLEKGWEDWPGRIRLSYKYDNQGGEDLTLPDFRGDPRIPCDYLRKITIEADGSVGMCAHDWDRSEEWGPFLGYESPGEVFDHPARMRKALEHADGKYYGVCERCNYNVTDQGKVFYIR